MSYVVAEGRDRTCDERTVTPEIARLSGDSELVRHSGDAIHNSTVLADWRRPFDSTGFVVN